MGNRHEAFRQVTLKGPLRLEEAAQIFVDQSRHKGREIVCEKGEKPSTETVTFVPALCVKHGLTKPDFLSVLETADQITIKNRAPKRGTRRNSNHHFPPTV